MDIEKNHHLAKIIEIVDSDKNHQRKLILVDGSTKYLVINFTMEKPV